VCWLACGLDSSSIPAGGRKYIFTTARRPALGPTHSPINSYPGLLPGEEGLKRLGREADHSSTTTEVRYGWSHTSNSTTPSSYAHGNFTFTSKTAVLSYISHLKVRHPRVHAANSMIFSPCIPWSSTWSRSSSPSLLPYLPTLVYNLLIIFFIHNLMMAKTYGRNM
jgi:hypothetical protein